MLPRLFREFCLYTCVLFWGFCQSWAGEGSVVPSEESVAYPLSRIAECGDGWLRVHARHLKAWNKAPPIVFLGDSLTEWWRHDGREVWDTFFAPMGALNAGIAGDRTEHLLWRWENTPVASPAPRWVVLLVGTNNLWRDSPTDVYGGVEAIILAIRARYPETDILLLALLPRGDEQEEKVPLVNEQLTVLKSLERVKYLDLGPHFLGQDGCLRATLYRPDLLHLSTAGYLLLARELWPLLQPVNSPGS